MQKCRLCGKEASILKAYYHNAFVCEGCYIILDTPIINHPGRLELRMKMHSEYLVQMTEMKESINGGYY